MNEPIITARALRKTYGKVAAVEMLHDDERHALAGAVDRVDARYALAPEASRR